MLGPNTSVDMLLKVKIGSNTCFFMFQVSRVALPKMSRSNKSIEKLFEADFPIIIANSVERVLEELVAEVSERSQESGLRPWGVKTRCQSMLDPCEQLGLGKSRPHHLTSTILLA